ncbi:MAG: hypothetical protein PVG92_09150 [Holophagae bacterium]
MDWANRFKPAAAVPTQLLLAWLMWAAVGSALVGVGIRWSWEAEAGVAPVIAAAAAAVGWVKSRLVLDRAAKGVVERIRSRGDGRCLGGFLSFRSWALVVFMMLAGRVLRQTLVRGVAGPLYIAVGTALCLSSRISWQAWRGSRRAP